MKYEIGAGILLIILFVLCLMNINYMNSICDSIKESVQSAVEKAELFSDTEGAAADIEKAENIWNSHSFYTHIVLKHSVIDEVSEALSQCLIEISHEEAGAVYSSAELIITRLDGIMAIESISLGSIL